MALSMENQTENGGHVIDVDVGERSGVGADVESSRSCAVCLEPLEWVVIGQCGHREVCTTCALWMRYVDRNDRCFVCWMECPTVMVTGADCTAYQNFYCSKLSMAYQGQVGKYWYLDCMSAYFDNEEQFKKTKAVSLHEPPFAKVNKEHASACPSGYENGSHVIDIKVGERSGVDTDVKSSRSCVVCLEPLKWVAVGPCGHREVCSKCALRIRFFECDDRCCICRTECPTVIVIRANCNAYQNFYCSKLSMAYEGQVGKYWYLDCMSAYFDNEEQFRLMRMASLWEPPFAEVNEEHASIRPSGYENDGPPYSCMCFPFFR